MNIRFRGVMVFALTGVVFSGVLFGLMYRIAPESTEGGILVAGGIEMIAQFVGLCFALSSALFYAWLEARSDDATTYLREVDAHHRVVNEIRELVQSARSLAEHPDHDVFTLLPNDVWHTSRELLVNAHMSAHDPMDYAMQDFYHRVRILQKADAERVNRIGQGQTDKLLAVIERDALAVVKMGENLLALLEAEGFTPTHNNYAGDLAGAVKDDVARACTKNMSGEAA